MLGVDGVADFNALHSRKHDHEVQLYAFDVLAIDGGDLRGLRTTMRKTNLVRLLAPDGIFVVPFEQGEIGPQPIPCCLQHGDFGTRIEAAGSAVSRRAIARLDQGDEPQASGDGAGDGPVRVTSVRREACCHFATGGHFPLTNVCNRAFPIRACR